MTEQKSVEVVKKDKAEVEYIPYGAQDKIKLSVLIVQNLIAVKTKSGKTCSEHDAIKFIAMCQAKRLNAFEGDCFLLGYDSKDGPTFSQITAHQAFLKRAELHPEFDGMKSGIIVKDADGKLSDLEGDFYEEKDQTVVGGWATVLFKHRTQPMHKRLRLARFQKAWGIWQEDPAGMICKCAEADALRSSFPTMCGGLYLREEIESPSLTLAKPEFAATKPLFALPESKPEPEAEAVPQEELDHVVTVRALLKTHGLAEQALIDYLDKAGQVPDNKETLESIQKQKPELLADIITNWPLVEKELKKK